MAVLQKSELHECINCRMLLRLVRDIENVATPKVTANWLCPNCGHREVNSHVRVQEASGSYNAGPVKAETRNDDWTLATPDTGGYGSAVKPQ